MQTFLGATAATTVAFEGMAIRLAAQHCQSLESLFLNVPGLELHCPSNPYDAKGLIAAAIRSDNPVVFLEHKLLCLGAASPVPERAYAPPPAWRASCGRGAT